MAKCPECTDGQYHPFYGTPRTCVYCGGTGEVFQDEIVRSDEVLLVLHKDSVRHHEGRSNVTLYCANARYLPENGVVDIWLNDDGVQTKINERPLSVERSGPFAVTVRGYAVDLANIDTVNAGKELEVRNAIAVKEKRSG